MLSLIMPQTSTRVSLKTTTLFARRFPLLLLLIPLIQGGVIALVHDSLLKQIVSDGAQFAVSLIAAVLLIRAAKKLRREGDDAAVGWSIIAAGACSFSMGMLLFGLSGLFYTEAPYPGMPDLFFMLFYPVTVIGLARMPREQQTKREILNGALDLGALGLVAAMLIWHFNVQILLDSLFAEGWRAGVVASFFYSFFDFILLMLLFSRLVARLGRGRQFLPNLLFVIGGFFLIAADLLQGYTATLTDFTSGSFVDLGWTFFSVFCAFGALALMSEKSVRDPDRVESQRVSSVIFITYLWIGIVISMLFWAIFFPEQVHFGLLIGGVIGAIVLSVTRQFSSLREITDLNQQLQKLAESLEAKVEERTAERRELEQQLFQQQKLESIGTLAGGIAHDFNNVLTPIIISAERMLHRGGPDFPYEKTAQVILESAGRGAGLAKQILAFGRKQVLDMRPINVNAEVEDLRRVFGRLIGEHIQIRLNLSEPGGMIKGDQSQFQQILLNLVVNARDAMPDGGQIDISTGILDLDDPSVWLHRDLPSGRYVELSVTDTGCGMDDATKAHVFEPFFTTKDVGKGTGLGLSTVYGIVKQHGGAVTVYSEPGHGSTFRVYLPLDGDFTPVSAVPTAQAESRSGSGFILLVEDDTAVRELACRVLQESGYEVTTEEDGQAGLERGRTMSRIDLLLTDVVMPKKSGRELYALLSPVHPEMKVLFMSGFPSTQGTVKDLFTNVDSYIQKPFSGAALLEAVARVMDDALRSPAAPK